MVHAIQIGLSAAKATFVPSVVLWLLAAASVLVYYGQTEVSRLLDGFTAFQSEYGWPVVFSTRAFFCGVLPGIFLVAMKSIRPARPLFVVVVQILWCGIWGLVVDWFYCMQDVLFGPSHDIATVLLKTFVDQFPWTVLVVSPINSVFYFWMGRDFSLERLRQDWPNGSFFRSVMLPNLIVNWCVWIPVTIAVFFFPAPLRVHLSGLVSSFWFLMCIQIGTLSNRQGDSVT